jgi:hypothetical protein
MQASDRIAAATGMMIGISGLVLGILVPPLAAIGGAVYAVNMAAGMTVAAKIALGVLGAIGGGALGRGLSPVVNFVSAMVAGVAVRVTYGIALGVEKIAGLIKRQKCANKTNRETATPQAESDQKRSRFHFSLVSLRSIFHKNNKKPPSPPPAAVGFFVSPRGQRPGCEI